MTEESRRYSDREVSLIIRKALENQNAATTPTVRAGELSLDDLEAIARDSGIPVETIRNAAAEIAEKRLTAARVWLGAEATSAVDESAAIAATEAQLEELKDGIASLAGTQGRGARIGRHLAWTSDFADKKRFAINIVRTDVEIESGESETRITVRRGYSAAAFFTFAKGIGFGVLAGGALCVGGILGGFAIAGALGGLGLLAGAWLATRLVFRAVFRNGKRKAAELAARIKAALESFGRSKPNT